MNSLEYYQKLKKYNIPIEVILNTIFILNEINSAYFISFKKYSRRHNSNIFDIIGNITFVCDEIKVIKFGEVAIVLYHEKNRELFDKVKLNNINQYLNHPKVYENIQYGIKYSLIFNKVKIYKTASFNLKDDLEDFKLKINLLKNKIEELFIKLKINNKIELRIEKWYSKNYLIDKLKTNLNLEQKNYLIKLLVSSKFDKLSTYLYNNIELIDKYKLELSVIISYIKTHKIIIKTSEIVNWELILIDNIFKKDEM